MGGLQVITPVKDSIETALQTIDSVMGSVTREPVTYTVYNDFSTPENTARLREASESRGFRLVNLSELTSHPSPNYLLVLQKAQEEALRTSSPLVIVESDVVVGSGTLEGLLEGASGRPDCGMAACVTVDVEGAVNYPYEHARGKTGVIPVRKHCSFCCSLLTSKLLRAVDFHALDSGKDWFDVTVSHLSMERGLTNYLFMTLPVVHRPHGSRPWKQLKYTHPFKYYWLKLTKGLDKI